MGKCMSITDLPLLLLLSHFSCVRLCATPQMAAHQALPSLGFSRQEHWSGLPFPSPMRESESEVAQSCPTFRDPMDCSLPGSSIYGIFQARVLEWGAIQASIDWINKMWYMHTVEYYSSIKRNEVLIHVLTQRNLENTMPGESSHILYASIYVNCLG